MLESSKAEIGETRANTKIIATKDKSGNFFHKNCLVEPGSPMVKSGGNTSGTKRCQQYVCKACLRRWINVKEIYIPLKDRK